MPRSHALILLCLSAVSGLAAENLFWQPLSPYCTGKAGGGGMLHLRAGIVKELSLKRQVLSSAALAFIPGELDNVQKQHAEYLIGLLLQEPRKNRRALLEFGEKKIFSPPSDHYGYLESLIPVEKDDLSFSLSGKEVSLSCTRPEFLVISDFDDTLKISEVPQRRRFVRNVFAGPWLPVPGMAERMKQSIPGGSFHLVSASPWQFREPIGNFLHTNGFPPAILHLRPFRASPSEIHSFVTAGAYSFKVETIRRLLEEYPELPVVFIGDEGEKDPEVYEFFRRRMPQRIRAVFIRRLTVLKKPNGPLRFSSLQSGGNLHFYETGSSESWREWKAP